MFLAKDSVLSEINVMLSRSEELIQREKCLYALSGGFSDENFEVTLKAKYLDQICEYIQGLNSVLNKTRSFVNGDII